MLTTLWGLGLAAMTIGCLLPAHWLPRRLPNDKLLHAAGFALLTLPPCAVLPMPQGLAAAAGLFVFGVLIEVAQIAVRGRGFSVGDIVANGAGVLAGVLAGALIAGPGLA